MKEKIFQALKQEYTSLGLGDEILMAHAESLAALGLVTDMNLKTVVEGQKGFLEGLQKFNDKRAADAAKTARENAKKEFEDEAKKKAEDAKKQAEEEAKKKAEEEAKAKAEAEKAAAEAAKKKAEEEAEKARLEALKKQNEIPEWFVKQQEEAAAKAKAEREAAEARAKEAAETAAQERKELLETLKAFKEQNETLTKTINGIKEESDKAKAELAKKTRADFILSKAKEMGIPQTRIDEGFVIADEADEKGISEYLGKVASNIKATQLPTTTHQQMVNAEVSKSEMDAIAATMVK